MSRVLCAMSGGVDSSVAALLLAEAGHEVVGVFMRNGVRPAVDAAGATAARAAERSCCSASDARDAEAVAARLGVPFYAIDYAQEFGRIIDHFADEYRRGRTPNPCVLCNQDLKFGHLFSLADAFGADAVATGHYARSVGGQLRRACDADKDQTYYLFGVARGALPRARFPLGELTKAEVRERARAAGLATAAKPESMEICFVTSGDYRDLVRTRGGAGRPGRFVDRDGQTLGAHGGVGLFTIGQRRGLPALGAPHYVVAIRPDAGEVVLATADGLAGRSATVRAVNWLVDPPAGPLRAEVRIRARMAPAPARLIPLDGAAGSVELCFDDPVRAITPGQAAVFYRGEVVLGGGWLD
ncbi:MAG: tRNA 2-thiouridine(34) synthase MnmA [Planctomycetes bacterium]|nr:tRNA 2-thiouridine(34) synthase MnmA [Planctomycetota bacterium]